MSFNRRGGGGGYAGGNSGNYGNSYGQSGNNFSGSGSFGSGGGSYNGGGAGRFNNYNNYNRNPKVSPWESGVSPGGGMMPNVHPNQMALASDLLSKLLAPNQGGGGGYGGGQNWGPNPGMMRRQESFKNQNRRRPDNRTRRPPPKKEDKKKDSKPEADKNDQSSEANGVKKESTDQEHVDYDGIPTAVLFCHVCQKHMWDGASFEKHVRGRPHELMMTYLDEGYKMQVELMRHQIKASENQREIDLERMQAQNKGKAKPLFRNYCPMCNINFYGPLTGHRKSDRHRKLKQFLHPECKMCDMLFHTRLEWDDHKLSSDHLRKVGEQRRQFNPDLKDDEFELLDVIVIEEDIAEEMPVDTKMNMINDQEIKEEVEEDEETVAAVNTDAAAVDTNAAVADITTAATIVNAAAAVDIDIDVAAAADIDVAAADVVAVEEESEGNKEVKLEADGDVDMEKETEIKEENDKEDSTAIKKEKEEKYNPANVVGRELVVKTGGHVCRLCSVFMKNDEEAELHCQTATHYINFISITKLHAKINNRKRKMKDEKKENGDEDVMNTEETEGGEQPEKRARLDETEGDEQAEKKARLDETEGDEQAEKKTCLDETEEDKPIVEQNGTDELEPLGNGAEDDDVQEIKVDIPVINVVADEEEEEAKSAAIVAESEEVEVAAEPDPVKESPPPAAKTTPARGRGGRGRGQSGRRGRSSR